MHSEVKRITMSLAHQTTDLIGTLHDELTAHALRMNQTSVNGVRIGGPELVKNHEEALALLTSNASGREAVVTGIDTGKIATLYVAHAGSPYYVLRSQAQEDGVVILACWDIINHGTADKPSFEIQPNQSLNPLRIEADVYNGIIRVFQDYPNGKEIHHGDFSVKDDKTVSKIMNLIRKQTRDIRAISSRHEVIHNIGPRTPEIAADPNLDNPRQRRQIFDTLALYYSTYFEPLQDYVRYEDEHKGSPLHIYNLDASPLMGSAAAYAPEDPRGYYLGVIFDPATLETVQQTLYRTVDGQAVVIASRKGEGNIPTFHRNPAGENFYPAMKALAEKLPVRAKFNFDDFSMR